MQRPTIDVRMLRKNRGWLQEKAAEELGFGRSYLSAVESGKRGISINMMQAIIRVFDVKYEDFYNASSNKTEDVRVNRYA